ncbi:MAG TPA: hypothetical protein VD969_06610 [Symbiobacteriaceae bacterium]|nr:hypothetical protein [Symbiobacteriaceae bacterium]
MYLRVFAVLLLAVFCAGWAAGCSEQTSVCRGPEQEINICVNGKRIAFDDRSPPHRHEAGSLYVPVEPLARKLGLDVRTIIRADGQSAIVTVKGRPFAPAMAHGAKGVHVHDGLVYVPLRELAAAAGIQLDMDAETGTAGFAK